MPKCLYNTQDSIIRTAAQALFNHTCASSKKSASFSHEVDHVRTLKTTALIGDYSNSDYSTKSSDQVWSFGVILFITAQWTQQFDDQRYHATSNHFRVNLCCRGKQVFTE